MKASSQHGIDQSSISAHEIIHSKRRMALIGVSKCSGRMCTFTTFLANYDSRKKRVYVGEPMNYRYTKWCTPLLQCLVQLQRTSYVRRNGAEWQALIQEGQT